MSSQSAKVAAAIAFYFSVSISLVFLNKTLFSGGGSVNAPLFITWYQCVVSVVCCFILGELGNEIKALSFFPRFQYDFEVAKQVMPVSVIFVAMITFNNLCLQYVEVHFYQVARSLSILFNIAFSMLVLGQSVSARAILACVIVVVGFALGSLGEAHFSFLGTIFGVTSSVFVALNSIYVKKCMPAVGGNSWRMSLYNNLNACFLYLPIIAAVGEPEVLYDISWWVTMTITGVFGFLIGIATYFQIEVTSPLTHNISGTVKACVQSILSVFFFGSVITAMGALGIALVVAGSYYYAVVRRAEAEEARQASARVAQEAEAALEMGKREKA